jgi:hypothetical protein
MVLNGDGGNLLHDLNTLDHFPKKYLRDLGNANIPHQINNYPIV